MRDLVASHKYSAILLIALVAGCGQSDAVMSGADAKAIGDSVMALDLAMNTAVDGLDCETGLSYAGDLTPAFVSSGHVVRTSADLLKMCGQMVAPRSGAVYLTDTVTAHALSPNAAYVVREGDYTINFRDGRSNTQRLVMTTIWQRGDDGWKMVHLHESAFPHADSSTVVAAPE